MTTQVRATPRHAAIDVLAAKLRAVQFIEKSGIGMLQFLHVLEQCGAVAEQFLKNHPEIHFHPAMPVIVALKLVQLAFNSVEGILVQLTDDNILGMWDRVDSLFYNAWMQFEQQPSLLAEIKQIADAKGITFGKL